MSERPSEIYLRLRKAIEWVSREEKRIKMIDITHKDVKESNAIEIDGIEFVKVVRCKDCKHWKRMDNLPEHYGECLDSVFGYCAPREDFFCKNGERRSE